MTIEENVYSVITDMSDELRESHRMPNFIPFTSLFMRCGLDIGELKAALNNLYLQKKIRVHRGINDKLIELI